MTIDDLLAEEVPAMPPVSMAVVEAWGESALDAFNRDWRTRPAALDLVDVIERVLPEHGIHVVPASARELGPRYALTDPEGTGEINILVREDLWANLYERGRRAHHPRATIGHELGHAVMHVHVLRRRMALPQRQHLLARQARRDLPAYCDPEWQAWAFAGALLIPRRAIQMLRRPSVEDVATTFHVSEQFVQAHLKRIKLVLP